MDLNNYYHCPTQTNCTTQNATIITELKMKQVCIFLLDLENILKSIQAINMLSGCVFGPSLSVYHRYCARILCRSYGNEKEKVCMLPYSTSLEVHPHSDILSMCHGNELKKQTVKNICRCQLLSHTLIHQCVLTQESLRGQTHVHTNTDVKRGMQTDPSMGLQGSCTVGEGCV